MSSEVRSWRDAAILMLTVSTGTTVIQTLFGPILTIPFVLFTIYIPTVAVSLIYVTLRWRNRMS
ncbi:MAG: hypothetical protein QXI97_06860 [Nitrososphaerota archaeon]